MKVNGGLIAFSIGTVGVSNSEFTNSTIQLASTISNCQNSYFTNSLITTYNIFPTENIRISNCTFTNYSNDGVDYEYVGIKIDGSDSFYIENCNISGYTVCGIYVVNSGSSSEFRSGIKDVTVSNINSTGIFIYNTKVELTGLKDISGNDYGIQCLDNSHVKITGNKGAGLVHETQQIHDNSVNQVYATAGAFPYELRFNAIYDEDNSCLVEYEPNPVGIAPDLEVIYNYWGTNFNPQEDLCPSSLYYSWLPVWNLQVQNPAPGTNEQLFYTAQTLADSGSYTQAQNTYRQIVATYPSSKYAMASLKELFAIEGVATNNYPSLKNYFTGIVNQQSNDELVKIADFLSNLCDVKLQNYQTAISWYEDVIQDPPTFADSLFAIIDLGNLYLKMENDSLKSAPIGSLTEYIPQSKKQYSENRDYLISLLFKDEDAAMQPVPGLSGEKTACLLPNVPNPFAGSTTMHYELTEEATVEINVFDYTGKLAKTLDEGSKDAGAYTTTLFAGGLIPGIYFCTIKCNGIISDSQKITIVN